jgi:hypothetical protein
MAGLKSTPTLATASRRKRVPYPGDIKDPRAFRNEKAQVGFILSVKKEALLPKSAREAAWA